MNILLFLLLIVHINAVQYLPLRGKYEYNFCLSRDSNFIISNTSYLDDTPLEEVKLKVFIKTVVSFHFCIIIIDIIMYI